MFFIWLLIFLFTNLPAILAIDEFTVNETVDYQINQSITQVSHQINITNNFSQFYPQEYQLTLNGITPQNLQATDNQGSILKSIEKTTDGIKIFLSLPHAKAGKGQTTTFYLRYQLSDLVTTKGQTKEIYLPQYQNSLQGTVDINLKIPQDFGRLSFASIPVKSVNDPPYHRLSLRLPPTDKKILLTFGHYQLFDFELTYFLKNPSNQTSQIPIALPPDHHHQIINYQSITPKPTRIESDVDGNWLAFYTLPGHGQLQIEAKGQVKIENQKQTTLPPTGLLSEQLYWPVSHPQIQALATKYQTPKQIYDYVVSTLSYDFNRLDSSTRRGALLALEKPQNSLCTDFTDLFISIARAAGIPAREIEGFAYSNNPQIKPSQPGTDLLHAWPEFYDQKNSVWVAVDPTWEKTTNGVDYFSDLDLNHFTFVIHGQQSDYPPPPGSYKFDPSIKTVDVQFSKEELPLTSIPPQYQLQLKNIFSPPILIITNPNLHQLQNISIRDQNINLLPLESKQIPLASISLSPQINLSNQISLKNPHYQLFIFSIIIFLIFGLSLGGIILTKKK